MKKYFQNKTVLFFWACFLFLPLSHSVLAELSDSQKMEFVERLAQPFSEKKVFYRWVSEESWKTLVEAGEWTPELYEHYMSLSHHNYAGEGFYVYEDVNSDHGINSEIFLLQVEVESGRYLDLSQRDIQKRLQEKNIEIYNLLNSGFPPRIAVKYSRMGYDVRWVLKGRTGVKFKPFSSAEIGLRTLELIYSELYGKRKDIFRDSIKEDILYREQTDPSVYNSSFVEIVEAEHDRVYVLAAIHAIIGGVNFQLETVGDAVRWLIHAKRYLSDQSREKLIEQAKELPIQDVNEAVDFLIAANRHLSGAEMRRIILKTPNRSTPESEELKSWIPPSLPCYDSWMPPRSF